MENQKFKCPHCGTSLHEGDRFCPICGSAVEAPKAEPSGARCPHCGAQVPDLNHPCPYCGYNPAAANTQNGYQAKKTEEDKPIKGTALGVVLALFTGVIGLILCILLGDEQAKKAAILTFVIATVAGIVIAIISCIVYAVLLSGLLGEIANSSYYYYLAYWAPLLRL